MPRKRKRQPRASYSEKYRQIKESGFQVDLPKPHDRRSKSLITRYHRLIFGGFVRRNNEYVHTIGISSHHRPYHGKGAKAIKQQFNRINFTEAGVKITTPRIKTAYYPRNLGHIKSVTKDWITFQNKAGISKRARLTGAEIARAAATGKLKKLLNPYKKTKGMQLTIGAYMRGEKFMHLIDLQKILERLAESAQEKLLYSFGTFEPNK